MNWRRLINPDRKQRGPYVISRFDTNGLRRYVLFYKHGSDTHCLGGFATADEAEQHANDHFVLHAPPLSGSVEGELSSESLSLDRGGA